MSCKTAIFWPYLYDSAKSKSSWSWEPRYKWIADALRKEGYSILGHPRFNCDLGEVEEYKGEKECDVVIYNHCDLGEIRGDIIKANHTWFFKPTVPDDHQTTLDALGYGSYSSITYDKPSYLECEDSKVKNFFETSVKTWIENNSSKWGNEHFKSHPKKIKGKYALVLGQCGGDSVVNRQDFSGYFNKVQAIISELCEVYSGKVVVKLHPYTNGRDYKKGVDEDFIKNLTSRYSRISKKVIVVGNFSSVHHYLPSCEFVVVGNSGAGFETMMHHKPIISFCYPEYHWVTFDLRKLCELKNAIATDDWFNKEDSDKFLYWYMREYCFFNEESTHSRVKALLNAERTAFIKRFYADLSI